MKYGRNASYASCLAAPAHTNAPHHVAVAEVCLVCVCLVLGLIFRQVPKVPYTVLLLLGGFLFDLIIKLMITAGMTEPEFYAIMGNLDPHVILFVFLPALIFGSAFYTNMHVFLKQCQMFW